MPTDLGDEWVKRTDELGFADMGHYSETPDLPQEYRTDKWWKDAEIPYDWGLDGSQPKRPYEERDAQSPHLP